MLFAGPCKLYIISTLFVITIYYNAINVYCRELAPGAVCLAGDRAQGDDNKLCRDYKYSLANGGGEIYKKTFKL